MYQQQVKEERPLGELFSELVQETQTLIREEVALAQAEVSRKVSFLSRDAAVLAVAGVVGLVAFEAIIAAAIIALSLVLPAWASALIVGVVLGIVGYVLARRGLNDIKRRGVVPRQTIASLREDKEWVQHQLR